MSQKIEYSEASNPAFAQFQELIEWAENDTELHGAVVARVVLESLKDIDSAILMCEQFKNTKVLKSLWRLCMVALQTRCELHHLCIEVE